MIWCGLVGFINFQNLLSFFNVEFYIWESNHGRANHLGGNDKIASRNITPQRSALPSYDMLSSKIVIVLFTSRAEFNLI